MNRKLILALAVLAIGAGAATLPMIGHGEVGIWPRLVEMVNFEQTWINGFGVDNKWWGILPFLIPLFASLICVIAATLPMRIKPRDVLIATSSVVVWAVAASIAPRHPVPQFPGNEHAYAPFVWMLAALALALVAGTALAQRATFARRNRQVVDDQVVLDSA